MYRLTFLNGKLKGRRVAVREGSVVIGRDPACHLELAGDLDAAPRHASIEEREDVYFLCATNAANKLTVNGETVVEAVLKNGDQIGIGETQLVFQLIADQEPPGLKRRTGLLQIIAYTAVGLILLAELFFVLIAPLLQPPPNLDKAALAAARLKAQKKAAATNVAAVVVPAAATGELVHVRQLIDAAVAATNAVPVETFVAPVSSNLLVAPPTPVAPTSSPVATVIAPPTNDIPKTPRVSPDVTMLAESENMLREAAEKAARGERAAADQTLDRLQILTPDFLPAYVERAKLFEQRGLFREAATQWKEVGKRTAGSPRADEAKVALARIAKAEAASKPAPVAPPEKTKLSNRIEIRSVDRERFPASADYDELRVFHVGLKPKNAGEAISAADVRVTVAFYDRDLETGRIFPTRVNVPATTLRVEGAWKPGEAKSVTATYSAPKNFRAEELRLHRQRCAYEGYRIQLFYAGELVDEDVQPRNLPAD